MQGPIGTRAVSRIAKSDRSRRSAKNRTRPRFVKRRKIRVSVRGCVPVWRQKTRNGKTLSSDENMALSLTTLLLRLIKMCENKKARPSHAFYFKISLLPFPANQITYAFLRLTAFVDLKFKRLLHRKKKKLFRLQTAPRVIIKVAGQWFVYLIITDNTRCVFRDVRDSKERNTFVTKQFHVQMTFDKKNIEKSKRIS